MKLAFLLDKSGSMNFIKLAAIQGFNSFVADQREVPGEATMTLAQFSGNMQITYRDVPLADVGELNNYSYTPNGSTALYESVCKLADRLLEQGYGAGILAVLTDGQDTDDRSGMWQRKSKNKIAALRENGWQVLFLGANIDVQEYADRMGIDRQYAYSFEATAKGASAGYATLSATTRSLRGTCL